MTSDRWEQINRLYNAVVEVEEKERTSFLEKSCGGDAELRREVESLLAYDQQAQQFIDRPAMQMAAEKLAIEPPSLVGQKLGRYQVQILLGSGGMGDVYRARDTRLNRIVAIKVLPRHLLERSDLRQRFEREARAVASLNHPHICALYDIGQEGQTDFLVMEYLDGETLSQHLKKGPLPTEEVLRYSIEIAVALENAHRQGVIHRDLKPGNIMLTETGAKLLDFGLAKQSPPPLTRGTFRGVSATESKSLTEEGMILGTLEYMAPEQLEGKEADARTDIFALGVVIYEMATGQKAFEGDSKASLIAKILTFQPPAIGTIQPVSPPELDAVVQKCLAKKPEERWQTAATVVSELQQVAETVLQRLKEKKGQEPRSPHAEAEPLIPGAVPKPRLIHSRAWPLGFVGILLAVIAGSIAFWRMRQQPPKPPENKEMSFRAITTFAWDNPVDCAGISPDATYLAYCARGKLFVQELRTGVNRSLALPEGFYLSKVGWFPDGTKLLLGRLQEQWQQVKDQMTWQSDYSVWSVSILGGKPERIVDHAAGYASVSPDGSLVAIDRFNPDRQAKEIWLVGSNGEGLRKLEIRSQAGSPSGAGNPSFNGAVWSPNGKRLLYHRTDNQGGRSSASCDLRGEQIIPFSSQPTDVCVPHWTVDGRVIQLLDKKELEGSGTTVNLWETKVDAAGKPLGEARRLTQWSGGFSFSGAGYLTMTADGKRAAVLRINAQADIYVAELDPGGKTMKTPQRLTWVDTDDSVSDWTADSRTVLFESKRNGNFDLFKQDITQKEAEPIVGTPEHEWHPSLSPDGAFILYAVSPKPCDRVSRLMRMPVGGGPPERVLSGENIRNFSCAREAKLCVVAEEVEGKQVLTRFDPLTGRGEKLPFPDCPWSRTILSPQGRLVEKMKSGPEGLYVRVQSLTGGAAQEVTWKQLTRDYQLMGWSRDGKGIYVHDWGHTLEADFTALYLGLDGRSQVLWKRGTSPGWSFDAPVPSPNGRYLAFGVVTYESNAWLLENF